MKVDEINQLIRQRRSVYPPQFLEKDIPDEILHELMENAIWAPTHKLTQPWRYKVIKGEAKKRLGIFLAEKYRELNKLESFSVAKYEKLKMNPQKAGAVIAVCIQKDPKGRVPEWEEVASVGMSVQNIWISGLGYGLGGYWSTPDLKQYFSEFYRLEEGEECLGFFYLGYYHPSKNKPPRFPKEQVVKWIE